MSVGPYAGPVQRVNIEGNLQELFRRVEDLERVKQATASAGDYVFIEEIVVGVSDDVPIVFTDITQEFAHLHIEARLASYGGSPDLLISLTPGDPMAEGLFGLDIPYLAGSIYYQSIDNPTVPTAENTPSRGGLVARGAIVDRGAFGTADGVLFAHVQIDIPYYSLSDGVAMCSWLSTALMAFGDGEDPAVAVSKGGGYSQTADFTPANVTSVALDGGDPTGSPTGDGHGTYDPDTPIGNGSGLLVGSRACLYGIRGDT